LREDPASSSTQHLEGQGARQSDGKTAFRRGASIQFQAAGRGNMLNARALSELLSKNSDERLCKRWYLITPNGTLLAYSQPTDIKSLRRQVAIAAMSWQEHSPTHATPDGETSNGVKPGSHLHTLIIESEASNVLMRQIQPKLLLVLEGGVPPRKRTFEPRVTAEGLDGEPLRSSTTSTVADSALGTSVSSKAESSISTAGGAVLTAHRRKLDAMAAAISADFEQTGFRMPDESGNNFF
jgi:hypothetical protein